MSTGLVVRTVTLITWELTATAVVNTVLWSQQMTQSRAKRSSWKIWGRNVSGNSFQMLVTKPSGSTIFRECMRHAAPWLIRTVATMLTLTSNLIGRLLMTALETVSPAMRTRGINHLAVILSSTLRSHTGKSSALISTQASSSTTRATEDRLNHCQCLTLCVILSRQHPKFVRKFWNVSSQSHLRYSTI